MNGVSWGRLIVGDNTKCSTKESSGVARKENAKREEERKGDRKSVINGGKNGTQNSCSTLFHGLTDLEGKTISEQTIIGPCTVGAAFASGAGPTEKIRLIRSNSQ